MLQPIANAVSPYATAAAGAFTRVGSSVGDAQHTVSNAVGNLHHTVGNAVGNLHLEHQLHALNTPHSLAAGAMRATAPLLVVPTLVYLGGRFALGDRPNGNSAAANLGFASSGLAEGFLAHNETRAGAGTLTKLVTSTTSRAPLLTQTVGRVAGFLGKALPAVVLATGAYKGAQAVHKAGNDVRALIDTHEGRDGALRAAGGALLLAPIPIIKVASAVPFLLAVANDFGAFSRFDRPAAAVAGVAALAPAH